MLLKVWYKGGISVTSLRAFIRCPHCGKELMRKEAYPNGGCRANPKPALKDYRKLCLGCWMRTRHEGGGRL
jgi:hypothetical protein